MSPSFFRTQTCCRTFDLFRNKTELMKSDLWPHPTIPIGRPPKPYTSMTLPPPYANRVYVLTWASIPKQKNLNKIWICVLVISQLSDTPAKRIDDQNQQPGPCESVCKRETGGRCDIGGVIVIHLLIVLAPLISTLVECAICRFSAKTKCSFSLLSLGFSWSALLRISSRTIHRGAMYICLHPWQTPPIHTIDQRGWKQSAVSGGMGIFRVHQLVWTSKVHSFMYQRGWLTYCFAMRNNMRKGTCTVRQDSLSAFWWREFLVFRAFWDLAANTAQIQYMLVWLLFVAKSLGIIE